MISVPTKYNISKDEDKFHVFERINVTDKYYNFLKVKLANVQPNTQIWKASIHVQ